MPLSRNKGEARYFNRTAKLPYSLCLKDFEMAMQDILCLSACFSRPQWVVSWDA